MKFIKEMGRILFNDGGSLIIPGEVGHVDFPAQIIYDQHKYRPGAIIELEHTHPTGMFSLSQRDSDTLKTWSFTLAPHTINMSTITWDPILQVFVKSVYTPFLQPIREWQKDKTIPRKFEILRTNIIIVAESPDEHLLCRESFTE